MRKKLTSIIATCFLSNTPSNACNTNPETLETTMYGLIHDDEQAHQAVTEELKKLKKKGYHYVTIEKSSEAYAEMVEYMDGVKTKENLTWGTRKFVDNFPYFLALYSKARELGYTVVPIDCKLVDDNGDKSYYRDKHMFETIKEKVPVGEKVAIVIGMWHINEVETVYPLDEQMHVPLGVYLDQLTEGNNHTIMVYSECYKGGLTRTIGGYLNVRAAIDEKVKHVDEIRALPCRDF